MSLFYYDFETTGLNPYHARITEYCFVSPKGDILESLVNPGIMLSDQIVEITGITNTMVQDMPSISEKKQDISEFINLFNSEYVYLVAHNNSNFDRFFFKNIYKTDPVIGPILNQKIRYIDSIHLAKYLLPDTKTFNLKYLCKKFGITPGTHRARDDTIALKQLFEFLVRILGKKEDIEYDKLIKNPRLVYDILY